MTESIALGVYAVALAALAAAVAIMSPRLMSMKDGDATFLRIVFAVALLFRVAVAVGSYYSLPYGYFAPDEVGYVTAARHLLTTGPMTLADMLGGRGWQYFNAFLLALPGSDPLVPRLWNCLVGATTALLGYSLAWHLGAGRASRWTAALIAAYPSFVLWSSLNLKDADVWLLLVAGVVLATRIRVRPRLIEAVGIVAIIGLLMAIRQPAAVSLIAAAVVALIFASEHVRRFFTTRIVVGTVVVVLLAGVVLLISGVGEMLYQGAGLSRLAHTRMVLAAGAHSATNPDPGLETLKGALAFLPQGLVDFYLRPYPWEPGPTLYQLTRLEVIASYLLLPIIAAGIVLAIRRDPFRVLPALSVIAVVSIAYALALSNLGTIYRERAQVLIVAFGFVAVAISKLGRSAER